MKYFHGRQVIGITACLALLALIGCTGKRGPVGPAGPKGNTGDPGTSRAVYAGRVPATADSFFVAIPSMTLNDPSLVSTFVQVSPDEYDELPFIFQFSAEPSFTTLYASIRKGGVTLWFCRGLDYIIIVVR